MKSNGFIIFSLVLLVLLYPLVMRIEVDKAEDMTRLIPENALLYFEQRDGIENMNGFAASPLGKVMNNLDISKTGEKIGFPKNLLKTLENFRSTCTKIGQDELAYELLGKRFSIIVLSPKNRKMKSEVEKLLEENTVLISEPVHNAKFIEFLTQAYANFHAKDLLSISQYGKHHIKRIELSGRRISIVRLGGFFAISLNGRQLRRVIDVYDKDSASMRSNNDFVRIRKKCRKSSSFAFVDLNNARKV